MIWTLYNIKNLTEKEYFNWYQTMSTAKKARVNQFLNVKNRMQTVIGDHIARQLIAEWCKMKPEEIRFSVNEHGKPYAVDLPIHFNISHSDNYVFCAVSERPIGVDIETIRPVNLRIAKKFCSDNEVCYIADDTNRFFELWTAKEAWSKKIGCGITAMKDIPYLQIKDRLHFIQTKDYILTIAT